MGDPTSPLYQDIDETPFFDGLAKEEAERFGTVVKLILFDKEASTVDPIYDEPTQTVVRTAMVPAIIVEPIPTDTYEAREEGGKLDKDTAIHFARAHLEETLDTAGVVLGLSDIPEGSIVEIFGLQWDVLQTNRLGFLGNAQKWMRVECNLKRRTEFYPERRQLA